MSALKSEKITSFKQAVRSYYKMHQRDLPWRKTSHPYAILVSELMLQQTQVGRVIPYYTRFLKRFPSTEALSKAPQKEVLREWSGLGYNRRAIFLHRAAQYVESTLKGKFPETYEGLRSLPGVGEYTANAIFAFAYNKKVLVLETNIRTALIHHFFPRTRMVSEASLKKILKDTLPQKDFHTWYSALMDYGAMLKYTAGNKNRQSSTYTKQPAFKGSRRQMRGVILKLLLGKDETQKSLFAKLSVSTEISKDIFEEVLTGLLAEGLVVKKRSKLSL